MRRFVLFPMLGVAVVVGAVTLVALEGREVVVLRTVDDRGVTRATRTWVADDAGAVLIEAANPARPFLRDLAARPAVELVRGGRSERCAAEVLPNPAGHARIRSLLHQQYGWADGWIALLTDTSESVAVRLRCD